MKREDLKQALEKEFPGKEIQITAQYEVLVDGAGIEPKRESDAIQWTSALDLDLHNEHGVGTPEFLLEGFVEKVKKHLKGLESYA